MKDWNKLRWDYERGSGDGYFGGQLRSIEAPPPPKEIFGVAKEVDKKFG